jgi:hypothetical protein
VFADLTCVHRFANRKDLKEAEAWIDMDDVADDSLRVRIDGSVRPPLDLNQPMDESEDGNFPECEYYLFVTCVVDRSEQRY